VGQSFMDGDATIVWIERKRVYFQRHSRQDRVEYVDIESTAADILARARKVETSQPKEDKSKDTNDDKGTGSGSAKNDGRVASATPPRAGGIAALDADRIEAMGNDKYGVPREMAETVRSNPKMLNQVAPPPQIQPVYKGGGVEGFRVLGIQSNSIYGKLGIRNGDIILEVNNQIVDNPQKALSFFDKLGPNEDVGVKVNRRGRHRTLTYTLQ